ncbi:deoxyribonuclease [Bacilli bacterium]|nr:deoxyribonuclease [Bacilli bacterium]
MKYFDVHTHTNMEPLLSTADVIAKNCNDLNISYVDIGIDILTSRISIEHAKKHKNVYACVGIHPNDVSSMHLQSAFSELEALLKDAKINKIVAIGETGLDYHTPGYDMIKQQEFFIRHIELARQYNLPLMVHVRDAHEDTLKILEQYGRNLKVIIHCYSGNLTQTHKYINLGVWFSIPGVITFKNAGELRKIVQIIPVDKLLSETDAP